MFVKTPDVDLKTRRADVKTGRADAILGHPELIVGGAGSEFRRGDVGVGASDVEIADREAASQRQAPRMSPMTGKATT